MNYAERQAAGLCPYGNCSRPVQPGFSACSEHLRKHRKYLRRHNAFKNGVGGFYVRDLVGKGSVRGIKAGNTADPLRERTHRSTAAFMEVLRFYPGRKPYKAEKKIIAEVVRRHPEWEHRVESVRILADQLPILLGEFDSVVFEFTGVRPNETN